LRGIVPTIAFDDKSNTVSPTSNPNDEGRVPARAKLLRSIAVTRP